jgi:hypothetical protein
MRLLDLLAGKFALPQGVEASDEIIGVECAACGSLSRLTAMPVRAGAGQLAYVCGCRAVPLIVDPQEPRAIDGYRTRWLRGDAERTHMLALAGSLWLMAPDAAAVKLDDV